MKDLATKCSSIIQLYYSFVKYESYQKGRVHTLGADHLTFEGGGVDDFWSASFLFSSNLVGRIFFFLLNACRIFFFPLHFSAGFFFPQKKKSSYISFQFQLELCSQTRQQIDKS